MLKELLSLSDSEYSRVVPALFAYQFNKIHLEAFIEYVGDRAEGTRIKDIARANGYLMKNCKLYAYACHCARTAGEKLPAASAFEVEAADAELLKRLNLRHIDAKKYRAFTLADFDKVVSHAVGSSELNNYIGRFVSKKMRFLIDSYAEPRADIEAYLREMAIASVYKQYPRFESYLHLINVAKAQIHNKGQSFITSATTKSRQRLQRNSDGHFEATFVPIETIVELPAPTSGASELEERLQALAKIEHLLPERTRGFLLAAAGYHNPGFSDYLGQNNVDAVETLSWEKYMKKLHAYYQVTVERMAVVYANINRHIHRINHEPRRATADRPRSASLLHALPYNA